MLNDTVQIELTKGYFTVVDQIDADLANHKCHVTFAPTSGPYAARHGRNEQGNQCPIKLHRIIMERIVGRKLGPRELVDHKDGDGLNNRRSNLRLANHRGNMCNAKKRADNKSGFKGVCWSLVSHKWRAYGKNNGKQIHLGLFDTPEAAHEAYKKFAHDIYGEFAKTE